MASAPTVGTPTSELTSGTTLTLAEETRGLWIVLYGGSNTTFTHDEAVIEVGGLTATLHQSNTQTQVHLCGYYIEDITLRSDNVLSLSGATFGTSVNQYRARVFPILHDTNKVRVGAENGVNELKNGGSTTVTLNPGTEPALCIVTANAQNLTGITGTTGLTNGSNLFSGVAGPSGTSHEKRADAGTITGSTAVGHTFNGGVNTQRTLLGIAWIAGDPIYTGSSYMLGG